MRVVGIDPAPTKGLDTFDGTDRHVALSEARSFVDSLRQGVDVLVCWDSSLTGPPTATIGGQGGSGSDFSQRPIESFFSQARTGYKTPTGISVRGYSGCPHWALSRALLGLPKVGPYDMVGDALPFDLLYADGPPTAGLHIVEVHPAVAIWLWCRDRRDSIENWEYKKRDPKRKGPSLVLEEVWQLLVELPQVAAALPEAARTLPQDDDILDARMAYVLGRLWLSGSGEVTLLGSADHGTFLLPRIRNITDDFAAFVAGSA